MRWAVTALQGKTTDAAEQLLRDAHASKHPELSPWCSKQYRANSPRRSRRNCASRRSHWRGPDCDGQILVVHDLLGLTLSATPKFARQYATWEKLFQTPCVNTAVTVRSGMFHPMVSPIMRRRWRWSRKKRQ